MIEGVSGAQQSNPSQNLKRGVPRQERRANLLFPWNSKLIYHGNKDQGPQASSGTGHTDIEQVETNQTHAVHTHGQGGCV